MSVQKVDATSFDSAINDDSKVVFVDFNATWCGPCRTFAPMFEEFSNKHAQDALCISVDIDESRDLAMRYGISAVPTILIFKNGNIVDSSMFMGAGTMQILEDKLAANA